MAKDELEKTERIQREFEAKRAARGAGKKHVVAAGETLGDIALKYYGSASKEKWMAIYEANKGLIGDNPNKIKVGQELVIPEADE